MDGVVELDLKDGGAAKLNVADMSKATMVLTDMLIQAARAKGQAPVEGAEEEDEEDIAIEGEFADEDFDAVEVDDLDEDFDEGSDDAGSRPGVGQQGREWLPEQFRQTGWRSCRSRTRSRRRNPSTSASC